MTTKKYRPSLTPTQISVIIDLCKAQNPISPEAMDIIATLAPYYTKIQVGAVTNSHTVQPRKAKSPFDLLTELGADPINPSATDTTMSKPHYWQKCYEKYLQEEDKTNLTNQEIEAVYEHMYLHNLFTDTQKQLFEANNLTELYNTL